MKRGIKVPVKMESRLRKTRGKVKGEMENG
jgi:hypothetical protein